jgi:hypothetical protein
MWTSATGWFATTLRSWAILFRIVSSIVALLGVMVLVTYSPKNGIILLVIAFLVSPMGLPMFAVWILGALQGISHFFKSI